MRQPAPAPLIGIFVGGKSRRMAGNPKGLLHAPDTQEPLVQRLIRLANRVTSADRVVLVGRHAAYAHLELTVLDDAPQAIGPLGGLNALLTEAGLRGIPAMALACDLPYLTEAMLVRLRDFAPHAAIVAPQVAGQWQPFFARYQPAPAIDWVRQSLENGERALQRVFERAGCNALALALDADETSALTDWDRPEDIAT